MAVMQKDLEGVPVLIAKGKFYGGSETDELAQALDDTLQHDHRFIVVDMTECGRVTSPVLSALLKARADCEAKGGALALCGVGGQPLTILEMTKLILRFDHFPDATRAVAALLSATPSKS